MHYYPIVNCLNKVDGNYRPDLKGLRLLQDGSRELPVGCPDGNYRPDLKGLRLLRQTPTLCDYSDGNYRPDLKGLRLLPVSCQVFSHPWMEITDLI